MSKFFKESAEKLAHEYDKSLNKAMRYLSKGKWEFLHYSRSFQNASNAEAPKQVKNEGLNPYLNLYQYDKKDNIITYELNEKGNKLLSFKVKNLGSGMGRAILETDLGDGAFGKEKYLIALAVPPAEKNHKKATSFVGTMRSLDSSDIGMAALGFSLDIKKGTMTAWGGGTIARPGDAFSSTSTEDWHLINSRAF